MGPTKSAGRLLTEKKVLLCVALQCKQVVVNMGMSEQAPALLMAGEDKRTTLMVKNIPNKYTQRMLLATIDEQFAGHYDFFYLPIDFKNKCNVGYAFINMVRAPSCSAASFLLLLYWWLQVYACCT